MYQQLTSVLLSLLLLLSGRVTEPPLAQPSPTPVESPIQEEAAPSMETEHLSGAIPEELEYIPDGYTSPSDRPGTLEKLEYETWESFSYEQKTQKLTKTAWVYLPYGYDESKQYNILYLSHGG